MGTLARLLYGAHFTADQVTLQVETREQVPSAVSVSLEQVACWGVRVDGMQTAVSAQQQPPRYSLAIADGGFHCSIGRVDVNRGPAADGALRVRLSDKAVGALGQLAALTPLSGMRVAAEKLTADFVLALSPRGSSGLPAGIKLERSEVGAALTVNIASLGPLSGVAGLATQLLSQTLSSLIKDELALIITLDLGPALARFEESQVAALAARPLARAEPPGGFIWTELGRDSVGGDNAAAATLSWLNSTLSNASLGAEAASRVARVSRFRDSSERHSAAWLPFPVRADTLSLSAPPPHTPFASHVAQAVAVLTMQPPPALNATEPPDELFVPVALLPALPTLELGGLGMADVELTALSVAGLDSVEALSLTLEGERSILASATLGPLSLRARAWLTVTPPMPTDRQWRGEVDACDCGWTSRWACPTASPQEGQQVAENDGTACFAYCCRPPGLDQEVEIEASLEGAHAEAILALDPSAQALAFTSLQTAAARPECALAALGVAPRHVSLAASPARLRLRYAAVPSDGGDVLGSAVLAATSHALDFAIGSSAPGAIKDALDAFVSGLALEALEAFITRADHETCATSSPPASLADGGDGGAGTKASGLWRSQGGAGGREGAGEDDTGTGRRHTVYGGRAALVQAGSGWANETERQAAFAAATTVADDSAATEAAARANLALRALGVDELAVGEIASLSLVAPLATPAPLQLGLSDLRLSGVAAASELSFLAAECEASDGVDPFSGGTALYATKARAAVATSEPLSLSMALSISLLGQSKGRTEANCMARCAVSATWLL